MLTGEQSQALKKLDRARRAYHEAWRAGPWADLSAKETQTRSAWDEVDTVFPTESVIEIDDVPRCDPGAPMPIVLSDAHHTWVGYYIAGASDERAILRFTFVDSSLFGGPNDEALHGHRLYGRGLQAYTLHEVIKSDWITSREHENSVHPAHRGGWHSYLRHFIYTFHDETFECLAREYGKEDPLVLPKAARAVLDMGRIHS